MKCINNQRTFFLGLQPLIIDSYNNYHKNLIQAKVLYKKKDTLQKEFDFLTMMETFESNQKIELNRLKQISTLMMSDGKRFRSKGIELMENLLEEINRANMVKIRINYQKKLNRWGKHYEF